METGTQNIQDDPTYWRNVLMAEQDTQFHPTAILPGRAVIMVSERQSAFLILLDPSLDERTSEFDEEDGSHDLLECGLPEIGWV